MRVRFLVAAREEFSNAVSYSDSQKEGLGDEFADEVCSPSSRLAAALGKNQALPYQKVPIRSDKPSEIRFNPDHSRDASASAS